RSACALALRRTVRPFHALNRYLSFCIEDRSGPGRDLDHGRRVDDQSAECQEIYQHFVLCDLHLLVCLGDASGDLRFVWLDSERPRGWPHFPFAVETNYAPDAAARKVCRECIGGCGKSPLSHREHLGHYRPED